MTGRENAATGFSFMEGNTDTFRVCPLCRSSALQDICRMEYIHVKKCKDCGMKMLSPYLTPAAQAELFSSSENLRQVSSFLAEYLNESTWTTPKTARIYQNCLRDIEFILPQKGRILDVGCGKGAFLKEAAARGWKACGIEPKEEACRYLRNQGIEASSEDFTKLTSREKWDVISLWDLIEHVPNPSDWMDKIYELLKPGGLAVIATPNHRSFLNFLSTAAYDLSGGRVTQGLKKLYTVDHTLYFTDRTLRKLMENSGFKHVKTVKVNTDLSRYPMGPAFRIIAETLLALSTLTGLENRVIMLAQKTESN